MLSFRQVEQKCVQDYRKYSDTVAISFAIFHLLSARGGIAEFTGIEHKLKTQQGKDVTPDLVATFDKGRKGLIFELKWSLPLSNDLLEKEIRTLKKYAVPCSNWRRPSDSVDFHDLVLVCHIDDVNRVVDAIKKLSKNSRYGFLAKEGFSVWSWTITPPKMGERREELRLFTVYGKTRNQKIEEKINQAGGILFSEDVLTFLRFSFTFVKEKPPMQYTMTVLIQNIFPSFQQKPERDEYDIHVDLIYERAKAFFPSWHKFDVKTVQIKRKWLREALEKLYELGLCGKPFNKPDMWKIPIPTLRTRKPIQRVLCRKIARKYSKSLKAGRVRAPKPIRPKGPRKEKQLTEFL